jgi:LPXTG-motif cell wall-anchored protein
MRGTALGGTRALGALLIATGLILDGTGGGRPAFAQSVPVSVPVEARPGSDVAGTATLADLGGGRTRIAVRLSPAEGDHPTLVHQGPCAGPNPAPWYALANVQNGASVTDVNVAIVDLTRAPMSVNVHQSVQDMDTIVACADLVLPAGAGVAGVAVLPAGGVPPATGPSATARTLAALGLLAAGGLGLVLRRLGRPAAQRA